MLRRLIAYSSGRWIVLPAIVRADETCATLFPRDRLRRLLLLPLLRIIRNERLSHISRGHTVHNILQTYHSHRWRWQLKSDCSVLKMRTIARFPSPIMSPESVVSTNAKRPNNFLILMVSWRAVRHDEALDCATFCASLVRRTLQNARAAANRNWRQPLLCQQPRARTHTSFNISARPPPPTPSSP